MYTLISFFVQSAILVRQFNIQHSFHFFPFFHCRTFVSCCRAVEWQSTCIYCIVHVLYFNFTGIRQLDHGTGGHCFPGLELFLQLNQLQKLNLLFVWFLYPAEITKTHMLITTRVEVTEVLFRYVPKLQSYLRQIEYLVSSSSSLAVLLVLHHFPPLHSLHSCVKRENVCWNSNYIIHSWQTHISNNLWWDKYETWILRYFISSISYHTFILSSTGNCIQ